MPRLGGLRFLSATIHESGEVAADLEGLVDHCNHGTTSPAWPPYAERLVQEGSERFLRSRGSLHARALPFKLRVALHKRVTRPGATALRRSRAISGSCNRTTGIPA